ncbi:MAG: reductive dehalogenase [Chloroflexota bacterium]
MRKVTKPTYHRFITGPLQRFDGRNTAFSKYLREKMKSQDGEGAAKKALGSVSELMARPQRGRLGYEPQDYALAWAGRTIDSVVKKLFYGRDLEVGKADIDVSDPAVLSRNIKEAARRFGADLVGICEVNPAWIYSHWGDHDAYYSGGLAQTGEPIEIPPWMKYAVVFAIEMDYESIKRTPAVDASPPLGYGETAFTAASLATYISKLGYHALPSGNEYALSIPLAVDAGLGESSRCGIVITEEFGPRVRIAKVFTDLPLEVDSPVDLGVQHFCEHCARCAEACPGKAISPGERTDQPWDECNSVNVRKWPIKTMNCLRWWDKNGVGCGVCIRVCPFNKPKGWTHSLVRKVVEKTPLFDRFFVKMDRLLGYGKQVVKPSL